MFSSVDDALRSQRLPTVSGQHPLLLPHCSVLTRTGKQKQVSDLKPF